MSTIGSRIRERREALGLSQEDLARRLGYKSRSSINKIELEQRNLTQSKIKAIADALETTPEYIMGWCSLQAYSNSEQEAEFARLFEALSPERQSFIIDAMRGMLGK